MKQSRNIIYGLILALSMFLATCAKDENEAAIVAQIGEDTFIKLPELEKQYLKRFALARQAETRESDFKSALNNLLRDSLKVMEAYVLKMDQDSAVINNMQYYINYELYRRYMHDKVYSKYINEESIKRYYLKTTKEIVYRQILVSKQKSGQTRKNGLAKLDTILNEIANGVDFGKIALKFSDDANSAKKGGLIGPIKWPEATDRLTKALFVMESGDISKVIETPDDFYIIKIEKAQQLNSAPPEKMKENIEKELAIQNTFVLEQEIRHERNECVDSTLIKWNDKSLNTIIDWSIDSDLYSDSYWKNLNKIVEGGTNFEIFAYMDKKYFLSNLEKFFKEYSFNFPLATNQIEILKYFLTCAMQDECIVNKAINLGYNKDILKSTNLEKPLDEELLKQYNEKIIGGQIPELNESNLKSFYDAHKEDSYYQLEKCIIRALIVSDKAEAYDLWQKIENGGTFSSIRKAKIAQSYERDRHGQIRVVTSSGHINIGERAFGLKIGSTAGPIEFIDSEKDTLYAIIQCASSSPGKQLSYEEVRDKAANDFQAYHFENIEKKVINQLIKKYNVIIYEKVLNKRIANYSIKK